MATIADDVLADAVADYYADPLGFVMFAFPWGVAGGPMADLHSPFKWQLEILRDIGEQVKARAFDGQSPVPPIRFAVSSGHGIGKSTLVAWLVCWLMSTRPDCRITVTANTGNQLETKTWAAIQTWMRRCVTVGWFDVNQTKIRNKLYPESWMAIAQTCDKDNSESFAGQHSAQSSSVFIFDEASGVHDIIKEVAEGGLVKGEPHIYAFGNPTQNSGWFFRACFGSDQGQWNHRSIDARDAGSAVSAEIGQWLKKYGEDSDFFRVRVRGLPPRASALQFIPATLVQESRARDHVVMDDEPLVAGYDAANGGLAHHVIAFRRGLDGKSIPPIILPGDTPRDVIVGKIADLMADRHPKRKIAALFGDQAFGSVVLARVMQSGFSNVFEVNFGGEAPDKQHHGNMRAHMWNGMKEWLNLGACPDNDDFEHDLTSPGFKIRPNGQLVLESKQDMAKRGVKSPDWGDAFALTFARKVGPPKKYDTDEYEERGNVGGFSWG
jgi:hypothetical protein